MLLAEPPRTNYDLHFRLLGIPVRVHPFFWLVALFTGAGPGISPKQTFIWMAAIFVSILVHEMGHAVAILAYGWRPWITLHALGGLASHERGYTPSSYSYGDRSTSPLVQIVISLAGPVAGFLFAALTVGFIFAAGGGIQFAAGGLQLIDWTFRDITSFNLLYLLHDLIFINLFWGLVNLLPIYPLDGGQIARELFVVANPRRGIEQSLWLSIGVAIAMAIYSLAAFKDSYYTVVLFGFLAFGSYQALAAYRGFGGRFGGGFGRYNDDDERGRGW